MILIDAEDFYERMKNDTDLCAEMEKDGLKALKKYLDLQPTAYDIGKVVEELESNSFITVNQEEVETKRKDIQSYISVEKEVVLLKDAIEIVKHGCESDDVCEWEKQNDYPEVYSTKCGIVGACRKNSFSCPYCGKKIKVVE